METRIHHDSTGPEQLAAWSEPVSFGEGLLGPERTRRTPGAARQPVNVGKIERIASVALGAVLVALGLKRRSVPGVAVALAGGALLHRGVRGHCPAYTALGVNTAQTTPESTHGNAVEIRRAITIQAAPRVLYEFWRKPENVALVMAHFAEVTPLDDARLRWKVRIPVGPELVWISQIVEDVPGEYLSWASTEGEVESDGSVRFNPAPGDRGTEATLALRLEVPGIGGSLLKHFKVAPRMLADEALRRLKSTIEAGEIPTLEKNPSARARAQEVSP